jgi:hypothetical protein
MDSAFRFAPDKAVFADATPEMIRPFAWMVPFTSNICCGFGVPIPTFPDEATTGPFTTKGFSPGIKRLVGYTHSGTALEVELARNLGSGDLLFRLFGLRDTSIVGKRGNDAKLGLQWEKD